MADAIHNAHGSGSECDPISDYELDGPFVTMRGIDGDGRIEEVSHGGVMIRTMGSCSGYHGHAFGPNGNQS